MQKSQLVSNNNQPLKKREVKLQDKEELKNNPNKTNNNTANIKIQFI
jgi:hypothetical protein